MLCQRAFFIYPNFCLIRFFTNLFSIDLYLDTLAQNGTDKGGTGSTIVSGRGSDLGNKKFLKGKAKRKLITQKMILRLIDVKEGRIIDEQRQSYWNTFDCQNRLYTADGRLYGRYCKNRY